MKSQWIRNLAACVVIGPGALPVTGLNDPLAAVLAAGNACPRDVVELASQLESDGLTLKATMVGNRGFHNGGGGSFSFFEMATGTSQASGAAVAAGDVLFGHFTAPSDDETLVLDQTPSRGALMVEALAWDAGKGVFNFYELIGDGTSGKWFYRGDSLDILADNKNLHRALPSGETRFGTRLRCAGCHGTGGPVMKELAAPHNDWWRAQRVLPLAGRAPDATMGAVMARLADATALASAVKDGLAKLTKSPQYNAALAAGSLQERLRPLFCPVEVNFASDAAPLDGAGASVTVPQGFVVNPLLAHGDGGSLAKSAYREALTQLQARFPETQRADGDHGFLAPVKSAADLAAIAALVAEGVVDQEFVADVLAVDFTNPVFSAARCGLLTFVPENAAGGWQETFAVRLAAANTDAAHTLHLHLRDPARDAAAHGAQAAATLAACAARAAQPGQALALVRLLAQRRAEIAASQISQNPRGQILEPGFRVIFPRVVPAPRPGALRLKADCTVE